MSALSGVVNANKLVPQLARRVPLLPQELSIREKIQYELRLVTYASALIRMLLLEGEALEFS